MSLGRPSKEQGSSAEQAPCARAARRSGSAALGMWALQRAAGNRAVTQLLHGATVQRHPALESELLGGEPRMASAHDNAPPLTAADARSDVAMMQQGLAATGSPPTHSTGDFDGFDGVWGPATTRAVRDFQQRKGIAPGGWEAGARTLSALDGLLPARPKPVADDLPELPSSPDVRRGDEDSGLSVADPGTGPVAEPVTIDQQPARQPPAPTPPSPQPPAPKPSNDVDKAVVEAASKSPSIAAAIARVKREGFTYHAGNPGQSVTNIALRQIFIASDVSQSDAVIRVIYETANAENVDLLREAAKSRTTVKDGTAWARKVIEAETTTVLTTARRAEEAGLVYNAAIQKTIRPFLVKTPDGLSFKPGGFDKAFALVFRDLFDKARTDSGELARDAYRKQWEEWKKLQER
ncbi:peptidoglycan-binding domain-containing protein [Actinoplanes sp. NPDC051470]|uniref:peptidoglycan-binding domain-containing protein n=1 Tax=unclassified Actinoplanes TaxID=2626549 RepID=UPI003441A46E